MTNVSEIEDAVEIMMEKMQYKECLEYIETNVGQNVLDHSFLFDTKLNCLYELDLDRKMDAFVEAKAYHADYRPLTPTVCTVLGNGYDKEGNHTEAHFYFSQFKFHEQHATLSRLVKEIEKEVKMKFDEKKFEECLEYLDTISEDIVSSSGDVFDTKIKCLSELGRKKEAFNETKAHFESGAVLSHHGSEILGSSYAAKGNYDEARQHYLNAIKSCRTREEKLRYRSLLKILDKEEETTKLKKEDKRVAKIDPSFVTKSTEKKVKQNKKEIEKAASQLQCVEDLEGYLKKEEEVEIADICDKIKKSSVTNQELSATAKFSVVELCNGIFNVFKEDYSNKSPMSLVKATEKHLENLSLLKAWGYDLPYMARVESALPPNSISSNPLLVVERIQPLHVFFTLEREEFMKTNSSSASKERDWWTCIEEKFRMIFRDIICGLFFLHSSNLVCSDFYDSLYVSKEGRGKILHNFAKKFSYAQAQQDVKDLVMLIVYAITGSTCLVGDSKDWKCHFQEIKVSYHLPDELEHFLLTLCLHFDDIALRKLPSTWLIDHPYFWDDKHRITFIKVLKDMIREDLISETAFNNGVSFEWMDQIKNDLLFAIANYKYESYRSETSIIFYMNAVYSHINDFRYNYLRGDRKLEDVEIECLLRVTFPTVYSFLFETLCELSASNPMHYTELFKKLSSCCVLKYGRLCLKESR